MVVSESKPGDPMKTTTVVPKREFVISAPDARSVCLAGDFTHWQQNPIPMKKARGGVWKASVNLQPGTYHYRFLVDGEWRDDPLCPLHEPNPFGTEDAVRVVA
jgi:1,4-alpha-glucan branching enzyme